VIVLQDSIVTAPKRTVFENAIDMVQARLCPVEPEPDPETELLEDDLEAYLQAIWFVIEPEKPYVGGWHVGAICRHVEAVYRRQIRNLLVTIPPRMTKSVIMSVAFPTWAWTKDPTMRFLTASYSSDLSMDLAVTSRRVIRSEFYQKRWGHKVVLTGDQNVKSHYENTKRGYRIATSVGGTVTGRGGDINILDDPHNLDLIQSDTVRGSDKRWYRQVWRNRLNDAKRGCRIVIMQRGHEDDLAADLIRSGEFVHLNLPNEFVSKKRCVTSIGWKDPRTVDGELLCEARFGRAESNAQRESDNSQYYTQYQQNPIPPDGTLFKTDAGTVKILESVPADTVFVSECRGWDRAATAPKPGRRPDWTAGVRMGKTTDGRFIIRDVQRFQKEPHNTDGEMQSTARLDGRGVKIREEQDPGAAGKTLVAHNERRLFAGFDYAPTPRTTDKPTHWRPFMRQWNSGNVWLVRGEWNDAFVNEMRAAPNGAHDDQLDSASTSFNEVALGGGEAGMAEVSEG
jgi:predicted phage terminase large subunit-like protein